MRKRESAKKRKLKHAEEDGVGKRESAKVQKRESESKRNVPSLYSIKKTLITNSIPKSCENDLRCGCLIARAFGKGTSAAGHTIRPRPRVELLHARV